MSRVLWDILRGGATILEALVMTYFVFAFQHNNFRKSGKGFKIFSYILSTLFYTFVIIATFESVSSELLKEIIYTAYFFIVSILLINGKIPFKILAAFICAIVDIAVEFVMPAGFEEVFSRFSAQIIKLIVYSVIIQAANNKKIGLGKKEWILILSVIGLSFVGIGLLNTISANASGSEIPVLLSLEACLILIAAVCFYMTLLLSKTQKESERFKLLSQQNEFRRQYAENAKKQYDDIRRIRHDIKHAYSVILTLLKEEKIDEAFEFIQKNAESADEVEVFIDVGDDVINALLNAKLSAAKQQGITVICNASTCISDIDKADLCNLLGNMLDNATEACVKCDEGRRIIEVSIKSFDGKRLIEISNSVSENVPEQNKLLKTTKADSELHGFGVKSIRSIAEKYGGCVNFVQEEDMFRCDVVLMR